MTPRMLSTSYQPHGPRNNGYICIYAQHGLAVAGAFVVSSSETRAFVCTGTEAVAVVVVIGDMVLVMVAGGLVKRRVEKNKK